jgi:uncharacterized repeat protein (TIGR01451 family)
MKSFGKSFGVRLAVGAATILSGVYAAALAQKDRQENSESWSSELPTLGQPVTPIEGQMPVAAASQPFAASPSQGPSLANLAADAFSSSQGSVQLVQHTEPVDDGLALPASLGSELPDPPATEPPSWTLPGGDVETQPAPAAGGPAMAFPVADENFAASPENQPTANAPQMDLPVQFGPMSDAPEGTFSEGPTVASGPTLLANPTVASEQAPTAALPTAQLQTAPDMQFFVDENTQFESANAVDESIGADVSAANPPAGSFGAPEAVASQPSAGPANLLRADSAGVNTLRSGPADYSTTAQQDPRFGTPVQPFDQGDAASAAPMMEAPAEAFAGSNAGPTSPFDNPTAQGVPSNQPTNWGQPQNDPNWGQAPSVGQPQARIASVPSQSNPLALGDSAAYPTAMEQPLGTLPIRPDATFDAPGERRLEGAQTPSVIIQKRAPAEVKVGKPASFVIQVQNVGTVEALDVLVHDRVPAGMRLVDASPAPLQQGNLLVWQLGSMPAGDERTLTMQLVPEQEGELGSVARVSFEAAASVRTIATRPELRVNQNAPETVLIGQQLEIELEVANAGSGDATGVVLQEDVPEGLEHPKGRQLDNAIGTLAPGEVRKQVLRLRAVAPGVIQNTIRLTGDDGLKAEHTVAVQVVAPNLQVDLKGPARRFLERPATYQLDIANAGTADATNVELSVQLARGFTFVSTDFEGQYDPSRHAVFWSLAQLPAGQSGSVPLTLLPVEEGEQAIVIDARADLGVTARTERKMSVEGFAELSFEITNPGGPIEMGAETTYQIRVTNSGSKRDSNVRVQLQVPQGLELISADTEAGTDGRGLIAFQPRAELAPGAEAKYSVRLRGTAPGTHLVKAVVVSDQSKVPVTKEESTLVYSDR